jgi:hypothetical protein
MESHPEKIAERAGFYPEVMPLKPTPLLHSESEWARERVHAELKPMGGDAHATRLRRAHF